MAFQYYSTASSFQRVEDVHLAVAIKVLRSDDNILPSGKELSGSLLDAFHADLKDKVEKRINGAISCLIADSWSNVQNDAIINYMAVSFECSIFLESVATGQISHNHEFIANDIARVIRAYEMNNFAGAVTDNTSTNKKAWKLKRQWFPSRYFQGCCSHGLHQFIKDVYAASKSKKSGDAAATYPRNYPFETMLKFVSACKDAVKYFHNHHIFKPQLREL